MTDQYAQYRSTSIQTAPPDQLLLMLYDGAIRFVEQAKSEMGAGQNPGQAIGRAQEIMLELSSSLSESQNELTQHLDQLYHYFVQRLFHAQFYRDAGALDEVVGHLRLLREAWAAAALESRKRVRRETTAVAPAGG